MFLEIVICFKRLSVNIVREKSTILDPHPLRLKRADPRPPFVSKLVDIGQRSSNLLECNLKTVLVYIGSSTKLLSQNPCSILCCLV